MSARVREVLEHVRIGILGRNHMGNLGVLWVRTGEIRGHKRTEGFCSCGG